MFSTMQIELLQMLDRARYELAVGYVGASVLAGYAAVSVATRLTGRATVGTAVAGAGP